MYILQKVFITVNYVTVNYLSFCNLIILNNINVHKTNSALVVTILYYDTNIFSTENAINKYICLINFLL